MVGQEKLVAKLKSYSITTLPHSILLVGESGCGKHTLAKELADYFNVDLIDISESISLDAINEISNSSTPTFYLIDCSVLTDRHQNIILKFLEEPSMYAYLILLCANKSMILQTVANRCMSFEFEPYTRDVLSQFANDEHVLDVCTTPGQVLSLHAGDLIELEKLCVTIITKIDRANYQNTLSIVQKINLKDEFDKFDIQVFFNVLLKTILNKVSAEYDSKLISMYNLVSSYRKRLRDSRLNKELFVENFLTNLWESVR